MDGYSETNPDPTKYGWYDLPGIYHHNAAGFSFADGHSEIRKWMDPRTCPPLVKGGVGDGGSGGVPASGSVDVAWVQERSTRRK